MIHDDCFTVAKQRWGTWISTSTEGEKLITALSEDVCVRVTRWYLKCRIDGFPEVKSYDGTVGGKL